MQQMFEYLINNHDKLLYLLAGVSLMIELGVMGMSGPLLFFAIACAITGVLVGVGWLGGWEMEVLSVGVISLLSALFLWKPLKQLQGRGRVADTSSDLIGQIVPVSLAVTATAGKVRHSGIDWNARLESGVQADTIESGHQVKIIGVDGTVIIVAPLD